MLDWLRKKAISKSQSNIDTILNNLVFVCSNLEAEIRANGGKPVASGPNYDLLMQQRQELFFQLNGPMSMSEVRAYLEPVLARQTTPRGVRLAVEATIKQYEEQLR